MNIVMTGTSRGIGLELCRLAVAKGGRVLAVARDPESSKALVELKRQSPELEFLAADVADPATPEKIRQAVRSWPRTDVLINNAGVYAKGESAKDFEDSFRVNSIAPFLITKALLESLKKSSSPKAIHISSQMGSIEDNGSGGSYAYRSSKAALNMINKSLSIDHEWLTSIVVHPGWVQTDMGGAGAPLPAPESATQIWRVIDGVSKNQSGHFLSYRGQELPW